MMNKWEKVRKRPQLKVKKLRDDAKIPTRGTGRSAGIDIYSLEDAKIWPGDVKCFHTGLAFEIPIENWGCLAVRSSLGKRKVIISAGISVVDDDYRGEVLIYIANLGAYPVEILKGDRYAQMVITPVTMCDIVEVDELTPTDRGGGGFGSTGR